MGKIHRWTLDNIAELLVFWITHRYDAIIFIEGNRGDGKSTLLWKILKKCKKFLPQPTPSELKNLKFKPLRDLYYDKDKFLKALRGKKYSIIWNDELIGAGYKRDFYTETQKDIIKAINMYRDSYNLIAGCIPRFADLDTDLQGLCKLRISVRKRGYALLFAPSTSMFNRDRWNFTINQKIEDEWQKSGTQKPRYSKLKNVIGYTMWSELNPKQQKLYDMIKQKKRDAIYKNDEGELDTEKSMEKMFYERLLDRVTKKVLTPKELQEICIVAGKDFNKVRNKLNKIMKEKGIMSSLKSMVNEGNKVCSRDILGFEKERR